MRKPLASFAQSPSPAPPARASRITPAVLRAIVAAGIFASLNAGCMVAEDDASPPASDTSNGEGDVEKLPILPSTKAKQLAVGSLHACAVTAEGAVRCWGYGEVGQLGDGGAKKPEGKHAAAVPMQVVGLTSGVQKVATYSDFSCALTAAGGVKCWGRNDLGQLGTGVEYTDSREQQSSLPVDVRGLGSGVVDVSTGTDSACAVLASGKVMCWGQDGWGKLGNDSAKVPGDTLPVYLPPVEVVGLNDAAQISVGHTHACAVTTAGRLYCWGSNMVAELGVGEDHAAEKRVPVEVTALGSDVASVVAGRNTTCAILKSGTAKCWGDGSAGQIGDGQKGIQRNVVVPADVVGASGVTSMSKPSDFTCAAIAGAAKCWGESSALGLAEGPTFYTYQPAGSVVGLESGVAEVATGADYGCARKTDGTIACWGTNGGGQLGDGNGGRTGTEESHTPVRVKSFD